MIIISKLYFLYSKKREIKLMSKKPTLRGKNNFINLNKTRGFGKLKRNFILRRLIKVAFIYPEGLFLLL